ncbi:hypothetical protein ACFYO1_13045 [Nocardia sp. NPDC006044]|uniref:hypothetical protein n=1 Tax=Nocardia sp. NPDC006044 TaxID=3364306 RepID=UPI0036AFFEB5
MKLVAALDADERGERPLGLAQRLVVTQLRSLRPGRPLRAVDFRRQRALVTAKISFDRQSTERLPLVSSARASLRR